MSRKNRIFIGNEEFSSKENAKKFIRAIRDSYADNEMLDENDHDLIFSLLQLHPEACEKIGCGIKYFTVETQQEIGRNRHFILHRLDGTYTDFSFISCIDGHSRRADVISALRQAVAPQIIEFKERFFRDNLVSICPYTQMTLSYDNCHVDHTPPLTFISLAEKWMAIHSLCWDDLEITPSQDRQLIALLTCPNQNSSWRAYHHSEAKLRVLSPRGNLSNARKRR